MEIEMNKEMYLKNNSDNIMYRGEVEIEIEKNTYICEIKAITKPTKKFSSAYLKKIINKKSGKETGNKGIKNKLNRRLYKLFLGIDNEIIKIRENEPKTLNVDAWLNYERPKSFMAKETNFTIYTNLNKEDLLIISEKNSSNGKLVFSSTLKRLETFKTEWINLVNEKKIEVEYQKFLISFNDLFPIIFNIDSSYYKKEVKHIEGKTNKTDIEGENWIIELKKPTTKLFNIKNSRNNITGISSDFASAENQLSLYVKKKNRERKLLDAFTKGILIIGSNDQIQNEDFAMTLDLMKQKSNFEIWTFDDITKRVEKCIEHYK